jgi:hypothetical protein
MHHPNLCKKCNQNVANPGFNWCEGCFQQSINQQICKKCNTNVANQGFNWCENCLQQSKNQQICKKCNTNVANQGFNWCENCFQQSRNQQICKKCSSRPANPGFNWCENCFQESRNQQNGQKVISFYHSGDPYYEFTNFYPAEITMLVNGKLKTFPTSEHFYQFMKYEKTPNWEQHHRAICSDSNPRHAFNYARKNAYDFKNFDTEKVWIMHDGLLAKFSQHPKLASLLKGTGSAKLVEHTSNDNFWGDGGNGTGQNILGKLLEQVRNQI